MFFPAYLLHLDAEGEYKIFFFVDIEKSIVMILCPLIDSCPLRRQFFVFISRDAYDDLDGANENSLRKFISFFFIVLPFAAKCNCYVDKIYRRT